MMQPHPRCPAWSLPRILVACVILTCIASPGAYGTARDQAILNAQQRAELVRAERPAAEQRVDEARNQVTRAQAEQTVARNNHTKSRTVLDQLDARLRTAFDKTPEMAHALDDQKKYEAAVSDRRALVLTRLKQTEPKYQQTLTQRDESDRKIKALANNPDATADDRASAGFRHLEILNTLAALETDAINNDPASKEFKTLLELARAKVQQLIKAFEAEKTSNPEWIAASQDEEQKRGLAQGKAIAVKEAQTRLTSAQTALQQVIAKINAADRDVATAQRTPLPRRGLDILRGN